MTLHKYKSNTIYSNDIIVDNGIEGGGIKLVLLSHHIQPNQWKLLQSKLFQLNKTLSINNQNNIRTIILDPNNPQLILNTIKLIQSTSIILIGAYFNQQFIATSSLNNILLKNKLHDILAVLDHININNFRF